MMVLDIYENRKKTDYQLKTGCERQKCVKNGSREDSVAKSCCIARCTRGHKFDSTPYIP